VLAQVFNYIACRNLQVVLSKIGKNIKEVREKLKWVVGFLYAVEDYSLILVLVIQYFWFKRC